MPSTQTPSSETTAPSDSSIANLDKIDHIIVLMMENRSFDHMLGYLSLEGGRPDVDGLAAGMQNVFSGTAYPVWHLTKTKFNEGQDPCHDGVCVDAQVANDNGGFVANYADTHPGDPDFSIAMGYYNHGDLPTYDHLAAEFCVCDRWFASVAGATWPNRLYALAGRAAGSRDNPPPLLTKFSLPSFVRHLDEQHVAWRWYAHPFVIGGLLTTLQIADDHYNGPASGNYSRFDPDFLRDAAAGTLPALSWIDPDFGVYFFGKQNDDHPPADVVAGQELALKIYHAVAQGPLWNRTLLVIVYDEHGGFYDHVAPPPAYDDDPAFRQYGVRVPALIVSPWAARRSVSSAYFDHASIIKTILLRFCRGADGSIPDMGTRVMRANHLGALLDQPAARQAPPMAIYRPAVERLAAWQSDAFRARFHATGVVPRSGHGLSEFQQGLVAAAAGKQSK